MAVTSEPSPFTSVTVSPMEPQDSDDLPIELKLPLPTSSACSDAGEEKVEGVAETAQKTSEPQEEEKPLDTKDPATEEPVQVSTEPVSLGEPLNLPYVPLDELVGLIELEAYQRRQAHSAHTRLAKLRASCGIDKRLISTFSIAYGDLIDQYKTDDQAGFAGLYEACEQLKSSCTNSKPLSTILGSESEESPTLHNGIEDRPVTDTLPPGDQENILVFLTQIRTEPSYLAGKISNLTPIELTALTSSYHPAGIDFSILQNHSHGKSQFFSRDSQMMKLSRRMDSLRWFHNQDPFFALLYGVFDSSALPGSHEYTRRMDVWSATCARTMVEGFSGSRPGSDELAIASLDAFANFQDWALKPKIEVYLLDILTKGAFLLEPAASHPVNFKEPLETHNARTAVAEAAFFDDVLLGLFDLLTESDLQRVVPTSALNFIHAVLRRVEDPKLRLRAQQFIVTRWYFATYISSIAVYPEVRGIIMTQHIGETSRRLILQKLVVKMQELVFDVILPRDQNTLINPRLRKKVMAIFQSFDPPPMLQDLHLPSLTSTEDDESTARCLMLSPLDLFGLVQVLCPERAIYQAPVDQAPAVPSSDRPSTAGSSTLIAEFSDIGSSVTIPANSGYQCPGEISTENSSTEKKASYDLSIDALKVSPKPKSSFHDKSDAEIRKSCQKLKDLSVKAGGLTTDAFSTANYWTLVSYSKDGSELSLEPIGIGATGATTQKPVMDLHNKPMFDEFDGADTNIILKRAIVTVLDEDTIIEGNTSGQSDTLNALGALMKEAMAKAHSSLDYRSALAWWENLQAFREYLASHPSDSSRTIINDVKKDLQEAVDRTANIVRFCGLQSRSLDRLRTRNRTVLADMEESRNALRVKMWYASDVRHSATYEEALYVTRALRTMASSKRPKQAGSVSSWARQRLRGSNLHDRAESQTLEAMVSSKDHGGLSKLADEQVEITSRWLTRKSIENFCKGEERIHRFCYEVQRSVGKIAGASLLESPVLWSSNLFRRERAFFNTQRSRFNVISPVSPMFSPPSFETGRLQTSASGVPAQSRLDVGASARSPINHFGGLWNATHPPRQSTDLGLYGNQFMLPPTPTSPPMSWASNPFTPHSPLHQGTASLSTPLLSIGGHSRGNSEGEPSPEKKVFSEEMKKVLCSLMISDLGFLLWNQGSETDTWVNDYVEDAESQLKDKPFQGLTTSSEVGMDEPGKAAAKHQGSFSRVTPSLTQDDFTNVTKDSRSNAYGRSPNTFPFVELYKSLLHRMSLTHDPYVKLGLLYELEDLIIKSIEDSSTSHPSDSETARPSRHVKSLSLRSKSMPRTKANSLEEVIANCTERRAGTLKFKGSRAASSILDFQVGSTALIVPSTDNIVNILYSIFRDSNLRPKTLFRDIQYIAAFIPTETLDQTPQGKAFWDVGLAALALKEDLCESMIGRANTITAYHVSPLPLPNPTTDTTLATTTLRDAANLWLITAKEGSPIAARELGLFYLTHPELLPRVTMPFSKAKDVFKSVMPNDMRPGDKEKGALDPYTFAVVFHWMEIAANGGDKDAKDFLKGNGELSGGGR